jgi:hypothetical protein
MFKKGDKVRCVHVGAEGAFTVGKIYTVRTTERHSGITEILKNDRGLATGAWYTKYFERVKPQRKRNLPAWW